MNFDEAFEQLLDARHEGRTLSVDPHDKGNWTGGAVGLGQLRGSKFGISAAAHPTADIAGLTEDGAKAIYQREYWGPAGCDAVPDAVRFDLFDMAVNSGVRPAVKVLQKAAGMPPEECDGIVGPHTLMAIQQLDTARLLAHFNGARLAFLTDADGWQYEGRGWAKRIATNLMEV
jgi:lysozyme family protein